MTRLLVPLIFFAAVVTHALPWTTHGPATGRVLDVAASSSNADIVYMATEKSVFQSVDRGLTWKRVSELSPADLIVDATDPYIVYALSLSNGLYRSTDGASTWVEISPSQTTPTAFAVDPKDPRVLYCGVCQPLGEGSEGALLKSIDSGATWERLHSTCVFDLTVDPLITQTLYADSQWRSDDGGRTWSRTTLVPSQTIVAHPRDSAKRFGIYGTTTVFLVSEDAGATWIGLRPQGVPGGLRASSLSIDPQSGRLFLATSSGIYRSGDGGRSWLPLPGVGATDVPGMVHHPDSNALTIATIDGIYRSEAFPWSEWKPVPVELDMARVSMLASSPHDPGVVYAATGNRLYQTRDFGRSWDVIDPSFIGRRPMTVDVAGTLYSIRHENPVLSRFYARADTASGWEERSTLPTIPFKLIADPTWPSELYAIAEKRLFHTRDGGWSWYEIPWTWTNSPPHYPEFAPLSLAIDPRDSNVLYMYITDRRSHHIVKSTDRGQTWSLKSDRLGGGITISRADPAVLYSHGYDGAGGYFIARSTDSGETWTSQAAPRFHTALVDDPHSPLTLYAATEFGGVFRSRDGGTTWESLNEGLPEFMVVTSLALDRAGSVLHVGLLHSGVWELPLRPRRRAVRRQSP